MQKAQRGLALRASKGFTLIELLVVIAIIGLLSSIVLASLNSARTKSRDARRVSDLKQLQTALELYYNDNTAYPTATTQAAASTTLAALVTGGYIATIPVDPAYTSSNNYRYEYKTTTAGAFYCIGANMEGSSPPTSSCNTGASGLGAAMASPVDYSVGP